MKDRIENVLAVGDKVLVELPSASIIGVISQLEEPGILAIRRGNAAAATPGRVIVACVIALPVDPALGATGALVKVYDAAKNAPLGPSLVVGDTSGPSKDN